MTAANDQQLSHADRHDLDKLARWKGGLDSAVNNGESPFPACAIFLVSPDDHASHDIFRRYRSAFEELGGGFHHLVILGQHGVSSTQVAFLAELGMGQESVPLLVIAPMPNTDERAGSVYCLELPKGDRDVELDDSQSWRAVLKAVRAAVSDKARPPLGGVVGLKADTLRRGGLSAAVDGILQELNSDR